MSCARPAISSSTRSVRRLFRSAAMGRIASPAEMLNEDDVVRMKQVIHAWRNGRQPPIVTHDLVDDADDPVHAAPSPSRPLQRRG